MHCFVISLEKDALRRAQIDDQLAELGLEHEVFNAVDGKLLAAEELRRCYDPGAAAKIKREMTLGEIGCALSHQGVYRTMIERDISCALVLEDDARPGPSLREALAALEPLLAGDARPQVVLLNCVKLSAYWPSLRLTQRHVVAPVLNGAWGAHGYVLNRAAAVSLLRALFPVRLPADIWDEFRREKVAAIRAVIPYCVGLSEMAQQSNLGLDRSAPALHEKSVRETGLKYWFYRYLYRKFIYQLFVRPFIRKQVMTW